MKKLPILLLLIVLLFTACSGGAQPEVAEPVETLSVETVSPEESLEPTLPPLIITDTTIVASGRLVPARSVELSFLTSGPVSEVLVSEGASVKAGDVLARLGNRETLEAEIARAELDLFLSKQALDELQARWPEEQTLALEALTFAQQALREAEQTSGSLADPSPASPATIEIARANVAIAQNALEKAQADYRPYANKPEDSVTRATLLQKLANAQARYDQAVRNLNSLLGVSTVQADVEQAEVALAIAQARVEQSQKRYDILANGPDPMQVEAANAQITSAETALAAANANMKELELVAPFDGTVVNQSLLVGEQISSGDPAMTLVDFSKWYVETDNLTEVEVVDVTPGQKVSITADAIPDVHMTGTVDSISNTFEEVRGNVTYKVRILLDEIDPRLRWGMTVGTTFERPVD